MRPARLAMLVVTLLAAPHARAQGPAPAAPPPRVLQPPPRAPVSLRLEYRLGPGATSCPGEDYLRQEVARRMGYDPFAPGAKGAPVGAVRVEIARSPKGLTGTYTLTGVDGAEVWTRTYTEPSTVWLACRGVSQGIAVELTGELQVREMRLARQPDPSPAPPASPPPPPPAAPPPPSPPTTPPPAPGPEPTPPASTEDPPPPPVPPPNGARRVEVGAGVHVGGGTAPRATLGGTLRVGLLASPFGDDRGRLSFALEVRADTAATTPQGIRTQLSAGSFVTCGHWDFVRRPAVSTGVLLCALGTLGILRSSWQERIRLSSLASTYVAAGARLGMEVRLSPAFALRAQGEALPTLRAARAVGPKDGAAIGNVAGNGGLAVIFAF